MNEDHPAGMPVQRRLFGAIRKSDAAPIALIESSGYAEATSRAAYVLGVLGLGDWDEVEVTELQAGAGPLLSVPTFLDAFFKAATSVRTTH